MTGMIRSFLITVQLDFVLHREPDHDARNVTGVRKLLFQLRYPASGDAGGGGILKLIALRTNT